MRLLSVRWVHGSFSGRRHVIPLLCCGVCACVYIVLVQLGEYSSRATTSTLTQARRPVARPNSTVFLWNGLSTSSPPPPPLLLRRALPPRESRQYGRAHDEDAANSARTGRLHTGLEAPSGPMPPHAFARNCRITGSDVDDPSPARRKHFISSNWYNHLSISRSPDREQDDWW